MRISSTRAIGAAGLSLAIFVAGAWPASAADAPRISSTEGIGLFAPDWKDSTGRTDEQWASAAKNFAVLMGTKERYGAHLSKMKAANPDVTLLMYNLGPYLLRDSPVYADTMATHPEYFARDRNGNLITVKQQPQMTLMDQGNPGWRALHVARIVQFLGAFPAFDGVQVDCMGWGAVRGYTTATPIDPTTGKAYTVKQWLGLSVLTLNEIKAAVAPKLVMFNGLGGGISYGTTKILATSNADGGMAEGFMKEALADSAHWPSLTTFRKHLGMVTDMAARGKAFFAWTKTWGKNTTDQNRAEWNDFALATYLLGKGDYTYYNFLPSTGVDRTVVPYANQQAKLGKALGKYTETNGIFTRAFENGSVRVDVARHAATITLSR